ncbi:MAG: SpoIID/LytB domain-containing protein [Candidatus Limnocylindrales bacterium]
MSRLVASVLGSSLLLFTLVVTPVKASGVDEPKYIVVCEVVGSCTGSNLVLAKFETVYVGDVLPHEWVCSWSAEAVKSGAVAVRTYGWWRVEHPRSSTYDIYGTSSDQNFVINSHNSTCDSRISATAGTRVEYSSSRAFTAYRAETGNPTQSGGKPYLVSVSDPHTSASSTGPGLCQNGSQAYGSGGTSYTTILHHYYTSVAVATGANYFVSEIYVCNNGSKTRVETWVDSSDGSTFTRSYAAGTCPV